MTFDAWVFIKTQNAVDVFSSIPFKNADLYNITITKVDVLGLSSNPITSPVLTVGKTKNSINIFTNNNAFKTWKSTTTGMGDGIFSVSVSATKI